MSLSFRGFTVPQVAHILYFFSEPGDLVLDPMHGGCGAVFPMSPAGNTCPGIYDTLLEQTLEDLLSRYPELRTVFGKLESEEQGSRYAEFVSKVLKQPFHRFLHGTPAGT